MCLSTVELASPSHNGPYLDDKLDLPKFGWKVVDNYSATMSSDVVTPFFFKGICLNKWQTDINQQNIGYYDSSSYPAGFHLYLNKEDADLTASNFSWVKVYKAEFQNVVAIGKNDPDDHGDTIVVRIIKVLS